jgi:hypothetical protein
MPDPVLLDEAVKRNDPARVRDLLKDATEGGRRACAKAMRPLLTGPEFTLPGPVMVTGPAELRDFLLARMTGHPHEHAERSGAEREREEWKRLRQGTAFLVLALGLAGGVGVAVRAADDHPSYWLQGEDEVGVIAGVLADRRPEWLAEFVTRRLRAEYQIGLWPWPLARELVRLGVIARPDAPQYTTRMPAMLPQRQLSPDDGWQPIVPLADALLADPGLLEEEIWRLFTVPDAAWELAKYGDEWPDALASLAERGHLDRSRLLDACLDAFTRDFAPNRVSWYVQFHDRMSPSLGEMAVRAGKYLALLAVNAKPGVTLGQRGCGRLLDAGLLAPGEFLAASGPALLFPQKSAATAQLKLIAKIAARHPAARGAAMAAAAQAFAHQREDVQEAALKLIARYGIPDGSDGAAIGELAAALSPALTAEAAALVLGGAARRPTPAPGAAQGVQPAGQLAEVPGPAPYCPSAGQALPPPLDEPEELVQLLARLMEDASDALAVERALAGAVRLAVLPAGQRARLAAPLLKRARRRAPGEYVDPFSGREIAADVACLALAWADGWQPTVDRTRRPWGSEHREAVRRTGEAATMAGILSARLWEACTLIASGHPVRLLAEPEFDRGAISPGGLLERLGSWAASSVPRPPRHDLEVALLRLAPDPGDSFWREWARLDPLTAGVARRIHEDGLQPLSFEPVTGVPDPKYPPYVRARSDDPYVLARITSRGSASGHPQSHCWALLTALASPLKDHRRLYVAARWELSAHYDAVVAAWPLLCPWQPELCAAHLLRPLSDGLRPGATPAAAAAACLASRGHALGPVGHLALMTGLASAEPHTRITAAEAWSQASLDGRLDAQHAANAIVTGLSGGVFKLNRIADALQRAAGEPIAAYRAAETIFAAADALIPAKPPGLHLLFELTARIAATAGIPEPPAAIIALAAQKSSSKLAVAARRLAALRGSEPAPARDQAITQALTAIAARSNDHGMPPWPSPPAGQNT